jgi:hypothetical protein
MDTAYQNHSIRPNTKPRLAAEDYKHRKLPTVRCTCGKKILIVPDLAAMNKALKQHKEEHKDVDEDFLVKEIIKALANRE